MFLFTKGPTEFFRGNFGGVAPTRIFWYMDWKEVGDVPDALVQEQGRVFLSQKTVEACLCSDCRWKVNKSRWQESLKVM